VDEFHDSSIDTASVDHTGSNPPNRVGLTPPSGGRDAASHDPGGCPRNSMPGKSVSPAEVDRCTWRAAVVTAAGVDVCGPGLGRCPSWRGECPALPRSCADRPVTTARSIHPRPASASGRVQSSASPAA
jgi:hypothetical protein